MLFNAASRSAPKARSNSRHHTGRPRYPCSKGRHLTSRGRLAACFGDPRSAPSIGRRQQRLGTKSLPSDLGAAPAVVIPQLKEVLAQPDPELGYANGELRFFLGWAQEVAGEHAAAQESWHQARSELEPLLKEQPENCFLLGNLALTNAYLGDKAAALALAERCAAANPVEKDAVDGPQGVRD